MNRDFWSWGLRLGSVSGIQVRLHWILLLYWFFELDKYLGPPYQPVWSWALYVLLVFLCIFLHELGHCFAARRVGGSADDILLWPLGGLAFCEAPNNWRAQLIVAAGGPLVSLVLRFFFYVVFLLVPQLTPGTTLSYAMDVAEFVFVDWQLYILLFNLVPLYPLDGGRMFHAALWGFLGSHGRRYDAYGRATMATLWASRVTAIAGIVFAIFTGDFFILVICGWAWLNAEGLKRFAEHREVNDNFLGYDFSQGYTSLERRFGGQKKRRRRDEPSWLGRVLGGLRARLRRRQPTRGAPSAGKREKDEAASPDDRQRVDELLEKISRDGMGALTRAERKFLERVSKRWSRDDE